MVIYVLELRINFCHCDTKVVITMQLHTLQDVTISAQKRSNGYKKELLRKPL